MLNTRIARTLAALLTLSFAALAQAPGTGSLVGTVVDPTGRALVDADVEILSTSTHLKRSVHTSADGIFRAPLLQPGTYDVTASSPSFATTTTRGVRIVVSEVTSLNVKLALASDSVTIDVTFRAPTTDTETSTLGGLVDASAIQQLPLSTRNYTQTLGLAPGVIADLPTPTTLGNGTQNVATNGATPLSNNLQFNGVDANNLVENSAAAAQAFQTGTAIPSPDAIAEFKIQTANYDASYGRGNGANVDLVTRSGTNKLHGSVFEFVRNNLFNANDFFAKQTGTPRAELKQNQFGAALGGPILRDKTFFFVAYQGTRQVNGLGDAVTTTLPLLTNDRSAAALGAQFCPATHLNTSGTSSAGYITGAQGTQVACDGSNINPVALKILNTKNADGTFTIPNPQTVVALTDPTNNQLPEGQITFRLPATYNEDQGLLDIDHTLSARNSLAGRFFYSRANTIFPIRTANVPGFPMNSFARNTMFVLADTHTLTPSLINIARFGYMRYDGLSSISSPLTAQSIGQTTADGGPSGTAPAISFGGIALGDAGTPTQFQVTNTFVYQDTVALTRGRHHAAFGAEFKRNQVAEEQPQQASGNVMVGGFEDFLVGLSAAQNGSPIGASNIGGTVAGGGIFRRDERYNDLALFAQDNITLTSRLTLNAGLRYEVFGSPLEIHGRLPNFVPALAQQGPLTATGTFAGITLPANYTGPLPAGAVRTSFNGFYKTPLTNFGPRVGFAYQLTSDARTVLRGGYGIYYDRHTGNIAEQTLGQLPFATLSFAFGAQAANATLANPFTPPVPAPSSFPVFLPFNNASSPFIEATDPDLRDARTYEYNLNVQRDLGGNFLFQIGYVGNQSTHRSGQIQFDQADLASPAHPINGETTNTTNNAPNRMRYQGISEGSLLTNSIYIANFNALEATVTRRMSHGFQMQAAYTWSKNLDEVANEGGLDQFELQLPTGNQTNVRANSYGPAGDDRAHRFVLNFLYEVPTLHAAPFLVRQALGHWQFSGIGVIQSGNALSIFDGNAASVYGILSSAARAQLAPGAHSLTTSGSTFSRVVGAGRWLNAAAITRAPIAPFASSPADQDFGNSGVGIVRGPGQHALDFAVERIFPLTERLGFRFRAEAFNLTNTPQFSNPNTSIGFSSSTSLTPTPSANYGRINSEQGGPHPRILQLAAKLTF